MGKIVGIPTSTAWAQVVAIKPYVLPQRVRDQPFFAAVSLENQTVEAGVVGKEVLATLEEEFFKIDKQTVFEAFGRSCKAGLQKVEESLGEGAEVEFNLVAASLDGEILHLAQIGEGQIWLWRRGHLGPILDQPTEGLKQASGRVFPGDILVLATPMFWEKIIKGELRAALAGGEVEEAVDGLTPKVHGLESSATVAALFVKFEREEPLPEGRSVQEEEKEREEEKQELPEEKEGVLKKKWEEMRLRPRIRPIFIRGPEAALKRRRRVLLAAFFLIFLLFLSIVRGVTKRGFLGRKASFKDLSSQVQEKIEAAEDFSSLNPKRANELLIEAQGLLERMRDLRIDSREVKSLEKEIAQKQRKVLKIHEIETPALVFDLSLIKPKVEGVSLSLLENKILVLSSGSVFAVDPKKKKGEMVLAGKEFSEALFLSGYFVFSKDGIFKIDLEEKKTDKVVEREEGWDRVKGFSTYLENLYLLDTGANQIKKYVATASGYLPPQDYLKDPSDLSNGIGLAIDGLIYILKEDGQILKYLQGKKDYFQVSGLDKSFSKTTACYTDPGLEDFYVLDKGNKRIVVLTKTGEYERQYVSEILGEARDFVVDSKEEKIYLLVGSKIYKINF